MNLSGNKTITYLATVTKVLLSNDDFPTEGDVRYLGAIEFKTESENNVKYAFPFDKNNITFPIKGETVVIMDIRHGLYWLPYSITPSPNYRQNFAIKVATDSRKQITSDKAISAEEHRIKRDTGDSSNSEDISKSVDYKPFYNQIRFLQPREGDTIIGGRAGNTIRFSQDYTFTPDTLANKPSPAIIIRNRQNAELDSVDNFAKLIDEDINKDGSSIWMTSNKTILEFNSDKFSPTAWTGYDQGDNKRGDQMIINSDRIILSSKAKEFLIYGEGNTAIITNSKFSIDSKKGIEVVSNDDIIVRTVDNKSILMEASSGGNILLGSAKMIDDRGKPGSTIQNMVLGNDLVDILDRLINAILQITVTNGSGKTTPVESSEIAPEFRDIKSALKDIIATRNWLTKE